MVLLGRAIGACTMTPNTTVKLQKNYKQHESQLKLQIILLVL